MNEKELLKLQPTYEELRTLRKHIDASEDEIRKAEENKDVQRLWIMFRQANRPNVKKKILNVLFGIAENTDNPHLFFEVYNATVAPEETPIKEACFERLMNHEEIENLLHNLPKGHPLRIEYFLRHKELWENITSE